MLAASEVEAFNTFVFVVLIFVLAVASELPSDVDAFVMFVLAVFTFVATEAIEAPSELLAFVTSD